MYAYILMLWFETKLLNLYCKGFNFSISYRCHNGMRRCGSNRIVRLRYLCVCYVLLTFYDFLEKDGPITYESSGNRYRIRNCIIREPLTGRLNNGCCVTKLFNNILVDVAFIFTNYYSFFTLIWTYLQREMAGISIFYFWCICIGNLQSISSCLWPKRRKVDSHLGLMKVRKQRRM